jgi:hypothetical protein
MSLPLFIWFAFLVQARNIRRYNPFPAGLAHIRADLPRISVDPAQALADACIRYWLEAQGRYHASEMNQALA